MKRIYQLGIAMLLLGFCKVGVIAQLSCHTNVNAVLDQWGTKVLSPQDIIIGTIPSGTVLDWAPAVNGMFHVDCNDVGNPIVVTATDPSGNTCVSNVVVQDFTPPVVYVRHNLQLVLSANNPSITLHPEALDDGSHDMCSGHISMSISTTVFDFSFANQSVPVLLTVVDQNGNMASELTSVDVVWSGQFIPDGPVDPFATYALPRETDAGEQTSEFKDEGEIIDVAIFPNPAFDKICVPGDFTNQLSVEVFNTSGKKVLTSTKSQMEISNLSKGVYFLRAKDGAKVFKGKFVKL